MSQEAEESNVSDHLSFYRAQGISPVRQDISDLQEHFTRREMLYRQLGILPGFISAKRVLEVGPGSGFNALYTASLEPESLVLLEPNPTGAADIRRLVSDYPEFLDRVETLEVDLFDFESKEGFDFVFCEGLLAGTPEPERVLGQLAGFVAGGGVLVVTSEDYISKLAETLRRLLADLAYDPTAPLDEQVDCLLPLFSPHLATLRGMSRNHGDWIIDNLINPASIGRLLSLPDTISVLSEEFEFFASSPHIVTDWRWYKSVFSEEKKDYNARTTEQYWSLAHNFIDYRITAPGRSREANRTLYHLCKGIRDTTRLYEQQRDPSRIDEARNLLSKLVEHVRAAPRDFTAELTGALEEARSFVLQDTIDGAAIANSRYFSSWFGRGQQYISFSNRL